MKYILHYWTDEENESEVYQEYDTIEEAAYDACKLYLEHKVIAAEVMYDNALIYHISHLVPEGEFSDVQKTMPEAELKKNYWQNGRERHN